MEWISVKDRLPAHRKDVFIITTDGTYFMARHNPDQRGWSFYFQDTGLQFDDSERLKPTHWAQPEPPNPELLNK